MPFLSIKTCIQNYPMTRKLKNVRLAIIAAISSSLPFKIQISTTFIVIGLIITIIDLFMSRNSIKLKPNWLAVAFVSYFLMECIGLLYTSNENFDYGLVILEKHSSFMFMPLLFLNLNLNMKWLRIILGVFIASCLVGTLVCIAGSINSSLSYYQSFFNEFMFSHDRLTQSLGLQPVYFALYLSFVSVILFKFVINNEMNFSIGGRIALTLLLIYVITFIVFLGARTITIGLIIVLIFNSIYLGKKRHSKLITSISLVIPLIFIVVIFFHPTARIRFKDVFENNYQKSSYGSYFARTNIWRPGIEVIIENPLIGVGTGDTQAELDKKYIKYNYLVGVQVYNMHNQYFQTLLGVGIVGLAIFLFIILVQLKTLMFRSNPVYLSFIMLFLFGCITESMLERNKGVLYFILFSFVLFKADGEKDLKSVDAHF